jgi:phosphatidylglycerol:prolipoprotein diacylglycerol transferase
MIPYKIFETIPLGPFKIQVWGLMVALAFLSAFFLAIAEAKRKKINRDHVINLTFYLLLGGILGGRLSFVLVHLDFYLKNFWEIFKIWQGGMIFYGGALLAFLFGFLYIKKHRLNFWQIADLTAPSLALGLFVGRIGCFLIHDHLGKTMKHPMFFGIDYFGEVRHEPALYELVFGLLMFLVLWFIRKRIKKEGLLFLIFLFSYSVVRFFIDYFREFDERLLGLTGSQYVSLVLFFLALWFLLFKFRTVHKKIK